MRAEGYCREWRPVASGDEGVLFTLTRSAAVTGTVLMPDGTPAHDARVRLGNDRSWRSARTDAAGRFGLDGLRAPGGTLSAELDGLAASMEIGLLEGGAAADVRLVLAPRERSYVRLRILDGEGRGIPGARADGWRAAEDGSVRLTLMERAGAEEWIRVTAPGFLEASVRARTSWSPDVAPVEDVALRQSGSVLLDVRAPDGAAIVDARARFLAEGVAHGPDALDPDLAYAVRIEAEGFLDHEIAEWRLPPGYPTLAVTLRPCASVRGRLADAGGDAWVVFRGTAGSGWAETDPEGGFVIGGLGEGEGVITAGRGEEGVRAAAEVVTVPGAVTDVGTLTLSLPVAVTGRVLDASARPLGGAELTCVTSLPGRRDHTFSHGDGTFRIPAPGFTESWIVARKRGFGTARLRCLAGPPRPLGDVVLPPPGAVELAAPLDAEEFALLWPDGTPLESGERRIEDVAPGRYIARLGPGLEREVEVVAGETTRVSFREER